MKKHIVTLTRIAATHKGNPLKASPLGILQKFFSYAKPAEQVKAFDAFCRAALKDQYCWRRGSPGNALHYAEQLEGLIEAAYLLYQHRRTYQPKLQQHQAEALQYLKVFFGKASPGKWKKRLHIFTSAALSHQSAADEMSAIAVYLFTTHIKQLLQVAAVIVKNME